MVGLVMVQKMDDWGGPLFLGNTHLWRFLGFLVLGTTVDEFSPLVDAVIGKLMVY